MAFPSDLVRTKDWGTEILYDTDLEGQLDLIINWVMAAMNATSGHTHAGTSNEGPKLSLATSINIPSMAQGDIFYASSSSVIARLAAGTAGYPLLTGGASANPSWSNIFLAQMQFQTSTPILLEGSTVDANDTTVTVVDPTAARTLTVPNEDVNLGQQVIKGWINFNGTGTIAINDSFNVTSITDNGTGDWTVTWDVDFASANYCPMHFMNNTILKINSMASGSIRVNSFDLGGGAVDSSIVCIGAIGDR